MPLTKLSDMIDKLKEGPKKHIVVVFGHEENTIRASRDAIEVGFARVTLVGDIDKVHEICRENDIDPGIFNLIQEADDLVATKKCIAMVKSGEADVLMKGLVSTDKVFKGILDKNDGLLKPGAFISHVSIAQIKNHRKLLLFSDAAFVPRPDIDQKIAMTRYLIETARRIGIKRPKVAIISFSEKANPKIKESVDGLIISKMGEQGIIKHADIDGPLSIDLALDPESVKTKGVKSCVKGDADCLIFPFLEVGNVFFKSLTYFAKAEIATYIVGTQAPVIISSRSDTQKSKFYSMAFTCMMARQDVSEDGEVE